MMRHNVSPVAILSTLAIAIAAFAITLALLFVGGGDGPARPGVPPLIERVQGSFQFEIRSVEALEGEPKFSASQAEARALAAADAYVESVEQAGPEAEDVPGTGFVLRESQFASNTVVVRHDLFESGHSRPMDVWVFVFDRTEDGRAFEGAPTMIVELEDGTGAVISAALISDGTVVSPGD